MPLNDLKDEILRFSTDNDCPADQFDALVCPCGGARFNLYSDETGGGALAVCCDCELNHSIYDTAEFMEDPGQHVCACDGEVLELMVGLARHSDGSGARWIYVGAKCPACDLVGVFVDWEEL